jgi:hypothetical protein
VLGGGGYSLPEYFGRNYPDSTIDVVEIDPKLESIAAKYLDYQTMPNVRSYAADGRRFIAQVSARTYDVVIVDAYSDNSVPFSLTTHEYAQDLAHIVAPGGSVLVNFIGNTKGCRPYLAALHHSYTSSLSQSRYLPASHNDTGIFQNIIGIFSPSDLSWTDQVSGVQKVELSGGQDLTDDFAPVEKLFQNCIASAYHRS